MYLFMHRGQFGNLHLRCFGFECVLKHPSAKTWFEGEVDMSFWYPQPFVDLILERFRKKLKLMADGLPRSAKWIQIRSKCQNHFSHSFSFCISTKTKFGRFWKHNLLVVHIYIYIYIYTPLDLIHTYIYRCAYIYIYILDTCISQFH